MASHDTASLATPLRDSGMASNWRRLAALALRPQWSPRRTRPLAYLWALVGVGVASLFIALAESQAHIANISLVYVLVVIWLAASGGVARRSWRRSSRSWRMTCSSSRRSLP